MRPLGYVGLSVGGEEIGLGDGLWVGESVEAINSPTFTTSRASDTGRKRDLDAALIALAIFTSSDSLGLKVPNCGEFSLASPYITSEKSSYIVNDCKI